VRVLLSLYPSSRWSPGGRERQVRELDTELKAQGIDTTLLNPWDFDDRSHHDLLHVFGSEYFQHELVVRARAQGIKVVVTSLLVQPSERSERRTALWRHVDRFIPLSTSFGLRRDLLRVADAVVCCSEAEATVASQVYGVERDAIAVIPLTVSTRFAAADSSAFVAETGLHDVVLSVGRIEPRKNPLNLIEAMRGLDWPLVLIGDIDPTHRDYADRFKAAVRVEPRVVHLPGMPPDDAMLLSAFSAARVHALVSLHEQVGLVNMEAAVAGANIVTTKLASTYEYFGEQAWYADPLHPTDIAEKIRQAYGAPFSEALRERLLASCTTTAVARRLHDLYRQVLAA
jgi:glycosyltransferase involved in cell wall biosynthesis